MSYQTVKRHGENCILLSERSQSEEAKYWSNPMTFWKRQNQGDDKMISDCRVWHKVERDDKQAEMKDFQSSENTLYDTTMVDTCHYSLSKPRECTPPNEQKEKYGL